MHAYRRYDGWSGLRKPSAIRGGRATARRRFLWSVSLGPVISWRKKASRGAAIAVSKTPGPHRALRPGLRRVGRTRFDAPSLIARKLIPRPRPRDVANNPHCRKKDATQALSVGHLTVLVQSPSLLRELWRRCLRSHPARNVQAFHHTRGHHRQSLRRWPLPRRSVSALLEEEGSRQVCSRVVSQPPGAAPRRRLIARTTVSTRSQFAPRALTL